jgi:hypothetical protein
MGITSRKHKKKARPWPRLSQTDPEIRFQPSQQLVPCMICPTAPVAAVAEALMHQVLFELECVAVIW